MKKITEERKENIFLALTKMHRDISNGQNKIKFYPLFKSFDINNDVLINDIKKAMIKMKLIIIRKDGSFEWNTEKTIPNPQLVEGILTTIRQTKIASKVIEKPVNRKINNIPTQEVTTIIVVNTFIYPENRTSITW